MPEHHDVIIIGGGPSGLTAAIYAARASLAPLVIEGYAAGGQLMITTDVENYPGFPQGVQGPELMQMFRDQAERFGANLKTVDVTKVDFSSRPFGVWTDDAEYRAETVIISTGASARWLGIESETRLRGYGVSSCATCDGFFFREQHILVVGGGDSALEEATFLTRFASKVTLVHRRDELRGSKIMQDRALANPKIEVAWNSAVDELHGEGKLEAVTLRDTVTGETRRLDATGLFIAIGHDPRSELLTGQVDLDDEGYVLVQPGSTATNLPGVFAAGDLVDHTYRQAITAAGTGCSAALDAERFLADLEQFESAPA